VSRKICVLLLLVASLAACTSAVPAANPALPTPTPVPPTATAVPPAEMPTLAPPTPAPTPAAIPSLPLSSDGWAVLAEKDDYDDVQMTNLPVDYVNVARLHQLLLDSGWQASHVRQVREFDRDTLQEGLDWLEENAGPDDVVFLYVAAHGKYLNDVLRWREFFAQEWRQVPSQRRLLVIDSCQAANYTGVILSDPAPYLAIAAVAGDEYGWSGLEEEGLPIIGGVFTHYFAAAFEDPQADADGNGRVSVQEAALVAEGQQRTYMHEVVFAVPEFLEGYRQTGADKDPTFPDVTIDDTIGQPLYLALRNAE